MLSEKIKTHSAQKNYVKIIRTVAKGVEQISRGYILQYSNDFILLQESDDFDVLGYEILPVSQITKIRFSKNEKYYNKIMIWEGAEQKAGISHIINLDNWQSIFKSIQATMLNVIVECQAPDIDTFTIGPILKTTEKNVYIRYFDAAGFIDEEPIKINLQDITRVNFDDRYINILSKYLRNKKTNPSKQKSVKS